MAAYTGPTQSCTNAVVGATTDASKSHATFNGGGVVAALYEQGTTAAGRALAYATPPRDFVGQLLPISVTASYQAVGIGLYPIITFQ